jgi:hypothetical protein
MTTNVLDIDSLPGALPPDHRRFRTAMLEAQQAMNDALDEFQRVTGRNVIGVSLEACEITTMVDQLPRYTRGSVLIAYAPTFHEREAESADG